MNIFHMRYATGSLFLFVCLMAAGCGLGGTSRALPIGVTTFAGQNGEFGEPFGIAVRDGVTYISDGEKGVIWKIGIDGKATVFASGLDTPSGIAFDKSGNLLVADTGTNSVASIDVQGGITILNGGTALQKPDREEGRDMQPGVPDTSLANPRASAFSRPLNGPTGVAVTADGNTYIADTYNDRIVLVENGSLRAVAGSEKGFSDGSTAKFDTPTGLAAWNDKLLVADTGNHRIRVVEPDGSVWTLAGSGEADLKDGTLLSASFVEPTAIAVRDDGTIFVADGNAIRVIGGGFIPTVRTLNGDAGRGYADARVSRSRFNRPSGLAFDKNGRLLVADSDNHLVRRIDDTPPSKLMIDERLPPMLHPSAEEFRNAAPGRWPFDPPTAKRDIAGTLGEIRGQMTPSAENVWFHNGLDIAGAYGETARFVRTEKVLRPVAAENFGTLRELIRMPTLGYIHVRLGRKADGTTFGDPRFQFVKDAGGKLIGVRVPRGTKFEAGDPIGTLNSMNHVHLIAGPSGGELNALDALLLPGFVDTRPPTIEQVSLVYPGGETNPTLGRIVIDQKTRLVMRAYDQVDGNSDRRRLGIYKAGYQLLTPDYKPLGDVEWTIKFDVMPSNSAVKFAYNIGSYSGATGTTIFDYIVTNRVHGDQFGEGFFDPAPLANGLYVLRIFAADQAGNESHLDIQFEVKK